MAYSLATARWRAGVGSSDWATTPLGPVAAWPAALRTAVRLMLASPVATSLWVGPSYTLIYNDRYRLILGAKHPRALGRSGAAVWDELWPALEPQFARVRRGEGAVYEDEALLRMERLDGGQGEDAWFTYALSALTDDAGECLAVYNVAVETTERVRARTTAENERKRLVEVQQELETTNELLQEQAAEMEAQAEESRRRPRSWPSGRRSPKQPSTARSGSRRSPRRSPPPTPPATSRRSSSRTRGPPSARRRRECSCACAAPTRRRRSGSPAPTRRRSSDTGGSRSTRAGRPRSAGTGEPVFVQRRDGPGGLLDRFPSFRRCGSASAPRRWRRCRSSSAERSRVR